MDFQTIPFLSLATSLPIHQELLTFLYLLHPERDREWHQKMNKKPTFLIHFTTCMMAILITFLYYKNAKYFIYSMENMQGNKKQDESIVPLSFPAESLL